MKLEQESLAMSAWKICGMMKQLSKWMAINCLKWISRLVVIVFPQSCCQFFPNR